MINDSKKEAIIIAGANGSGKTTFAKKFLDVTNYKFLNADEFAKTISPGNPDKAKIQAGKKVINSLKDIIFNNEYFDFKRIAQGSKEKIEILDKKLSR